MLGFFPRLILCAGGKMCEGGKNLSEYRTISGYTRQEANPLTHTMEDYLEMICRLSRETGFVRVHQLAETLHVKPSSVTKMAKQLQQQGLIEYQP